VTSALLTRVTASSAASNPGTILSRRTLFARALSSRVRRMSVGINWDPHDRDWIAIAMGAFDAPTSAHLEKHIFVAEKGDYYKISDGLPQSQHHN